MLETNGCGGEPSEPTILPAKPAGAAYFNRLDAVRGTAILWVLVFHTCGACWGWDLPQWTSGWDDWPFWLALPGQTAARICSMGGLGVPMFFVLSGFLIHYTFSRGSTQTTLGFWLRRFGRIYPPYIAALLVFAVAYGFAWTAGGRGDLLGHSLFVHTFKNKTFFSINGSFWSLAHEAQFYLLYPLLVRVRRAIGMQPLLWTSLAARLGIGIWLQTTERVEGPALSMMLPRLYFEWIPGMYVADQLLAGRRAFACQPGVGWICLACAFFGHGGGWWELAAVPAISVATAIWIDRVVHVPREPGLVERLLIPLGVISYSLYLWHQPIVGEFCRRIARSVPGLETVGSAGLFFIALAICSFVSIIAAVGAYRLIEVPSTELTKQLVQWLERRRVQGLLNAEARANLQPVRKMAA